MMLLSWGAPLMPAGGSCCSLLKSRINLFLAGVDIFLFLLVVTIFLFLYLSRERDLTIIMMWVNLSKNKDPWERYRGRGGGGGFGFFFLFLFYWWGGVGWGGVCSCVFRKRGLTKLVQYKILFLYIYPFNFIKLHYIFSFFFLLFNVDGLFNVNGLDWDLSNLKLKYGFAMK